MAYCESDVTTSGPVENPEQGVFGPSLVKAPFRHPDCPGPLCPWLSEASGGAVGVLVDAEATLLGGDKSTRALGGLSEMMDKRRAEAAGRQNGIRPGLPTKAMQPQARDRKSVV